MRLKHIDNSDVWLLSERGVDARDNGFSFYSYLKKVHPEIKIKYVISKTSPDRKKIQKADIIGFKSKEHYILFLTAGKLISTHIMGYSPNMSLFRRLDERGLLRLSGKRIFLQHGITKDAIPMFKRQKSLDLFVCGAEPEYKFLLDYTEFGKNIVKYLGFARYDTIKNNPKNQILVMPTFRRGLKSSRNFRKSEFCQRWSEFLSDPELKEYLKIAQKTLIFYPHHEFQKNLAFFKSFRDENIVIADEKNYDVQKLISESELLVTDYSSVAFDFAYLKKPVIYYQFDYENYRKTHYKEGYFSYEEDGFGPVVYSARGVIELFKKAPDQMYSDRAARFFVKNDRKNCERLYEAIK
ncbi:CDP-glycerol glycerophosphotransferase family protein [Candidatus Saccharibacteria bacterium]|nr:CDP-glycerol glycerophosphotransferase family protein [Candidatus Saccharibacteria bacterium]